jgi:hypothetical protein
MRWNCACGIWIFFYKMNKNFFLEIVCLIMRMQFKAVLLTEHNTQLKRKICVLLEQNCVRYNKTCIVFYIIELYKDLIYNTYLYTFIFKYIMLGAVFVWFYRLFGLVESAYWNRKKKRRKTTTSKTARIIRLKRCLEYKSEMLK